jgi:hypothetical protein
MYAESSVVLTNFGLILLLLLSAGVASTHGRQIYGTVMFTGQYMLGLEGSVSRIMFDAPLRGPVEM